MFDHALLGDFLDPDELIGAVRDHVHTADELDDIVHDRFGGKRYTDPTDGDPRPGPRRGDRRRQGVRHPEVEPRHVLWGS